MGGSTAASCCYECVGMIIGKLSWAVAQVAGGNEVAVMPPVTMSAAPVQWL